MFVDVDGEVVALDGGSRTRLRDRLLDEAIDWELTALLAEEADVAVLAVEEIAPLRNLLGRWHAEQGVLPDDLRRLQDALGAAVIRRSLVPA